MFDLAPGRQLKNSTGNSLYPGRYNGESFATVSEEFLKSFLTFFVLNSSSVQVELMIRKWRVFSVGLKQELDE